MCTLLVAGVLRRHAEFVLHTQLPGFGEVRSPKWHFFQGFRLHASLGIGKTKTFGQKTLVIPEETQCLQKYQSPLQRVSFSS